MGSWAEGGSLSSNQVDERPKDRTTLPSKPRQVLRPQEALETGVMLTMTIDSDTWLRASHTEWERGSVSLKPFP